MVFKVIKNTRKQTVHKAHSQHSQVGVLGSPFPSILCVVSFIDLEQGVLSFTLFKLPFSSFTLIPEVKPKVLIQGSTWLSWSSALFLFPQ